MDNYKPHIGKNVIETLTLGMYDDARFIYREYVQNAADQIDVAVEEGILEKKSKGEINITINTEEKSIIVEDNATGIKSKDVLQFLGDVANSQKDRTRRKGFRGIGRLGGLGYCDKLIFETSYKGESQKSIISLNAKQLRLIIEDRTIKMDASTLISTITTLEKEDIELDRHFFKVKLQNVSNEELLDQKNVREYLSMVAPVPFQLDFPFAKKIHNYFNKNNVRIEEYDVHLNINQEKLYKPYKTKYFANKNKEVNILDINFFKIKNEDKELLSIGWYSVSRLLNFQIPRNYIERGLRLRKDNIGIGSDTTLGRFFGQPRQVLNYFGEIHVISSSFIPNARRDYFNDNRTVQVFEKELKLFFPNLGYLTQKTSDAHSRKKIVQTYQREIKDFQKKIASNSLTKGLEEKISNELKFKEKKAIAAKEDIKKLIKKSDANQDLKIVIENVIGKTNLDITSVEEVISSSKRISTITDLPKLSKVEKRVVLEIFSIIDNELEDYEKAEMLKKKIAEHYN